jgi:o-succinylbenzoate---CoA ligase
MIAGPAARLARWPAAAPALAWPGGALSYGELRARIDTLAASLRGCGVAGSPVAVLSSARLDIILGVLAALRLGRPALPLDPARPDLEACLAACAPGAMLARHGAAGLVATALPTTAPAADRGGAAGAALLVATSGTGGQARVAILPAAALEAHVAASAAVLPPLGAADRWLVCLPMTSIGALAALWRTLSAGACLAFLEKFDAAEARRLMADGASHVSVVPAMLAPLADSPAPPARGLRCLLSGGGSLSREAAAMACAQGWPLWNGWGMTETSSHVAAGRVDDDWREGIVGAPLPGIGLEVEAGSGRLSIRGRVLMSGYAGGAPGAGLAADGSLLSADLGEWLADGRLRILGRADDVIVTGGVNVHPEGIETLLAACAGAGEVAITARPDARWGMTLVALYTGPASPATLEAWARERVPNAARPREYLRVASLPRNAMGKLLRHALPELEPAP